MQVGTNAAQYIQEANIRRQPSPRILGGVCVCVTLQVGLKRAKERTAGVGGGGGSRSRDDQQLPAEVKLDKQVVCEQVDCGEARWLGLKVQL